MELQEILLGMWGVIQMINFHLILNSVATAFILAELGWRVYKKYS